jgi:hypothetical protein
MMDNQTYYYGQGEVYFALRDINGRLGPWRWIGDVSELTVNFTFEQKISKTARSGKIYQDRRIITECAAMVTSTWHNFSLYNLALLLGGSPVIEPFSIHAVEQLPAGITKGDKYSLPHTNVFNVTISGLENDTDYQIDPQWGMIEFLNTPENRIYEVHYEHVQNESLPIFISPSTELSLRYQGVNLAEGNSPILVELYRLALDPLATLELINSGDAMAGMVTSAQIMADMSKGHFSELGYFGRIQFVKPLSGLTYDGKAIYDGKYRYRG